MRTIHAATSARGDGASIRARRIKSLARVLGAILCLATVHHPLRALSATVAPSYSVSLAWSGSTSAAIAGYNLYYSATGTNYTNYFAVGMSTTNTITGLVSGGTYYFAVTSYDTNGLESPFSNQITYTVPGPLPTAQLTVASAGQVNLTLTGQIGQAYNVLATQDFKTWTVIGAVTMGANGSAVFTDTNAAGFSRRFYCTQAQP